MTGIALRELLRASHARAWKDCENGRQRLDPYNGFLLNVALDALFDSYRISFDDTGHILIDPELPRAGMALLGISQDMKLRFWRRNIFLIWHGTARVVHGYESQIWHDGLAGLAGSVGLVGLVGLRGAWQASDAPADFAASGTWQG